MLINQRPRIEIMWAHDQPKQVPNLLMKRVIAFMYLGEMLACSTSRVRHS